MLLYKLQDICKHCQIQVRYDEEKNGGKILLDVSFDLSSLTFALDNITEKDIQK